VSAADYEPLLSNNLEPEYELRIARQNVTDPRVAHMYRATIAQGTGVTRFILPVEEYLTWEQAKQLFSLIVTTREVQPSVAYIRQQKTGDKP